MERPAPRAPGTKAEEIMLRISTIKLENVVQNSGANQFDDILIGGFFSRDIPLG